MSTGVNNATAVGSTDPTGADAAYAADMNALQYWLGADKAELEQLLVPIWRAQVSPQQAYALLKEAWVQLRELRGLRAELVQLQGLKPETVALLEEAFTHLQTDGAFSLEAADGALDRAAQACLDASCPAAASAAVIGAQAQLALARRDHYRAAELYARAAAHEALETSLRWHYEFQRAHALAERGREFMDLGALEEAMELFENQVLPLAPRDARPADWARSQHAWGDALGMLGLQQRGTRLLEQAIAQYQTALGERTREAMPMEWAATQNSLGHVMGTLAQRQADVEMLEQAIKAFEGALEVRSLEDSPEEWAIAQNNLGAALLSLGQSNKDKTLLKRSSDAYKNVLQVWTRGRAPLDWAMTMNNLGTALRALGEYRKGPRTLEQSVAAYRSALSERTRERVPQDWALTQNNLGAALHKLGEREGEPKHLEAAIEAYEHALQEWTHERGPLTWAMTAANQVAARKALAELTVDVELVRRCITDFRTIGEVFRDASHAQFYELIVGQVALLRKLEQQILAGEEEA